jgi:carbon monoxide dehydrogenase subunit G
MVKISRSIYINAPVEKIFTFLADPCNLPEVWPSMVATQVTGITHTGGQNFNWEYKMAGMRIQGESEVLEHIPNQKVITQSKKGIESKFIWRYQPEGKGTRLQVEVDYIVPVPLLGKLAESVVAKLNEHEADVLMENIKTRMEV